MAGLTNLEKNELKTAIGRRVGKRSDPSELATAYLAAMERVAYDRTVDSGPVPTSLTAERSMILIEISRQLTRVIEDYEIQALFRVTAQQARAMRTTLLATYTDDANDLMLEWSLVGARSDERETSSYGWDGTPIIFPNEDRRDGFVDYCDRNAIPVEIIHSDDDNPWKVVVNDDFPKASLPAK